MRYKVLKVTYDDDGNVESKVVTTYPCKTLEQSVTGLSDRLMYFYIEEEEKPEYDENAQYLKVSYNLSEEYHKTYSNLLVASMTYAIVDYDSDIVIEKLAASLGSHLDSNYPGWKRTKHLREYLNDEEITDARKTYLESLFTWEDDCRSAYDNRVKEYNENGIFPSFIWDDIPQNIEQG
jgi:hypothetical protein